MLVKVVDLTVRTLPHGVRGIATHSARPLVPVRKTVSKQ
jgi:hypothetical protein